MRERRNKSKHRERFPWTNPIPVPWSEERSGAAPGRREGKEGRKEGKKGRKEQDTSPLFARTAPSAFPGSLCPEVTQGFLSPQGTGSAGKAELRSPCAPRGRGEPGPCAREPWGDQSPKSPPGWGFTTKPRANSCRFYPLGGPGQGRGAHGGTCGASGSGAGPFPGPGGAGVSPRGEMGTGQGAARWDPAQPTPGPGGSRGLGGAQGPPGRARSRCRTSGGVSAPAGADSDGPGAAPGSPRRAPRGAALPRLSRRANRDIWDSIINPARLLLRPFHLFWVLNK